MKEQWKGFVLDRWTEEINVRNFIQKNYTPYEGNGSFLASTTEVTHQLWEKVKNLMAVEREKGILDTDTQVPS
jgi:formate C-acetyltransferase